VSTSVCWSLDAVLKWCRYSIMLLDVGCEDV
jgi:hypothetical protein